MLRKMDAIDLDDLEIKLLMKSNRIEIAKNGKLDKKTKQANDHHLNGINHQTNFNHNHNNNSLTHLNHNLNHNLNHKNGSELGNLNKLNHHNDINHNRMGTMNEKLNKKSTMTMVLEHKFFNDKHHSHNNDLDNHLNDLNKTGRLSSLSTNNLQRATNRKQQIKSTSFESNLTDEQDFNDSEPSNASDSILNGSLKSSSHSSNLDEDSSEIDHLIDKNVCRDQKIVEVVSLHFE